MLKDDRMMGMFTFLVVMVALGAVLQKMDIFSEYFGGEPKARIQLVRDDVIVRANALTPIDVLANDIGTDSGDAERLFVAGQPACGRVFVRNSRLEYLPAERCVGAQTFSYGLSGVEGFGEVVVAVRLGDPTQQEVEADAQRDMTTAVPATARRPASPDATPAPSALAPQPTAPDATAMVPTVPRPEPPQIVGLQESATASDPAATTGPRDEAPAVAHDATDSAPNLAGLTGGLSGTGRGDAPVIALPADQPMPTGSDLALPRAEPAPQTAAAPAVAAAPAPQEQITGDDPGKTLLRDLPSALESGALAAQGDTSSGAAAVELGAPGAGVSRAAIGGLDGGAQAAAPSPDPAEALRGVRELAALAPPAVDTAPPPDLTAPAAPAPDRAPAVSPAAPPVESVRIDPNCQTPPVIVLESHSAGITDVIVNSPCHAGTAANLAYDGLEFGIPINSEGKGQVAAFGLQPASDAVLSFAGGRQLAFTIAFHDVERLDRVALVWDAPVDLELHAFEFGARPQSEGHVGPDRKRSFADVRRKGGGFLMEYEPAGGVGQHMRVYTLWLRHGTPPGVVRLTVEFASRTGPGAPDTCGDGPLAQPEYMVLRATSGRQERPRHGRLAALDCATIAAAADRLIGDAVDDIVVVRR